MHLFLTVCDIYPIHIGKLHCNCFVGFFFSPLTHFQSLTVSHFLINFYFLNTDCIATKISNNNFFRIQKKKAQPGN